MTDKERDKRCKSDFEWSKDAIRNAYSKGYNDAKREISMSGEYERAYQRGYEDGRKSEWTAVAERSEE